jgi:hypothetical protein
MTDTTKLYEELRTLTGTCERWGDWLGANLRAPDAEPVAQTKEPT